MEDRRLAADMSAHKPAVHSRFADRAARSWGVPAIVLTVVLALGCPPPLENANTNTNQATGNENVNGNGNGNANSNQNSNANSADGPVQPGLPRVHVRGDSGDRVTAMFRNAGKP